MTKILGVIPARSGSKSIKNKNIVKIGSRHLIEFTIEHLNQVKLLKKFIVSTDSKKIISICKKKSINFINRPKNLSQDNSKMIDVIKNVIDKEYLIGNHYDFVAIFQPTIPFRDLFLTKKILKFVKNKNNLETVITVKKALDNHPARMYYEKKNLLLPINKKFQEYNRQRLPSVFHRDGSIYVINTNLIKKRKIYGEKINFFINNFPNHVNIDEKLDLDFARYIYDKKLV